MEPQGEYQDNGAVERFAEYLRIPTVHPEPDYAPAVDFLERQAKRLGLPCRVVELVPRKPIVIITWDGSDKALPSIIANSHMDVVPVSPEQWNHDPFGAEIEDGKIFARGSQDMKSVGMQYLEGIGVLQQQGFQPKRTLHVTFVPDEEIGGLPGMGKFVDTDEFKEMNVGFALDEGLASENGVYRVFNGERQPLWLYVYATGPAGHGSNIIPDLCTERLLRAANGIVQMRDDFNNLVKAKCGSDAKLGSLMSANITALDAGVGRRGSELGLNVIPTKSAMGVDVRIPPSLSAKEFISMMDRVTEEEGVSYEFVNCSPDKPNNETEASDKSSYWAAFRAALENRSITFEIETFPAATDSRFLRGADIPAIGFSPMANTPILLHDHDEFLSVKQYLFGITVYEEILRNLLSLA